MKVSNSPLLLESKDNDEDERENEKDGGLFWEAAKLLPQNADQADVMLSGESFVKTKETFFIDRAVI